MESTNPNSLIFNAANIKKYWKDQQPPENQNEKFEDKLFLHNDNSIHSKNENGEFIDQVDGAQKAAEIKIEGLEWKSAKDIFSEYFLFVDKIEVDDIKQGQIGNCYFLSALAALCEFPELIYQIFKTKEVSSNGCYEIALFLDGEWQIVIVDDYFIVGKGTNTPKFARPNGNEIWLMLLEKAWAKVNGGYSNIIAGWPSDPLYALTGFTSKQVNHNNYLNARKIQLWNIIIEAEKNDNLMGTVTDNNQDIEDVNLIANHSYTLIGAKEYNGIKLVHIRNPWGNKEWNGRFSDNSGDWNDELKKEFNFVSKDDGTFFMLFEDFCKYFRRTDICYINYKSYVKSFKFPLNQNYPAIYNFYLHEESTVSISALRKHWRYNRELKNKDYPLSLVLCKLNDKDEVKFVDGEYSSLSSPELIKTLEKGYYGVWVYCVNHLNEIKLEELIVRFICNTTFKVRFINSDFNFDFIKEIVKSKARTLKEEDSYMQKKTFDTFTFSLLMTGISYRYCNNQTDEFKELSIDANGLFNYVLFPPFEDKKNFIFYIAPTTDYLILGIKTTERASCLFNHKLMTSNLDPELVKGIVNYQNSNCSSYISIFYYINKDVANLETDNRFYDYLSLSSEESKLEHKFEKLNINEIKHHELAENYSKEIEALNSLNDIKIDDPDRNWTVIKYENGTYIGQTDKLSNQRDGKGVYIWDSGHKYIGDWKIGFKHGSGMEYINEDISFKGNYNNGQKNGFGEQTFPNGDKVKCEFKDDMKNGKGFFTWANGATWEGPFENNLMHGEGQYTSEFGESFKVTYSNGQYSD